jgi:NDP-sugar pyrophosphorylase family protein
MGLKYKSFIWGVTMDGVILAAGKGTRLKEKYPNTIKPMVPVGDVPMIEYPLRALSNLGVDNLRIVIGSGPEFNELINYIGIVWKGKRVIYCVQQEPDGVVDAIKCGVVNDSIIIMCDLFLQMNMSGLNHIKECFQQDVDVALCTKLVSSLRDYGAMLERVGQDKFIKRFYEKEYISGGDALVGLLKIKPKILDFNSYCYNLCDLLNRAYMYNHTVCHVPFDYHWDFIDMGTPLGIQYVEMGKRAHE